MTKQQKKLIRAALEAIEAACNRLSTLEDSLSEEDRADLNEEAKFFLPAGFENFAKDGGSIGAFLNPVASDWEL